MRKIISGILLGGLLAPVFIAVTATPAQAQGLFLAAASHVASDKTSDKTKDGGGTPRPTPPPGPPK